MAGGGGGAVGMRLNIMTALYLPILGYAMSTFDLNPDALVLSGDNLQAYAVPTERSVPVGQQFTADIMYQIKPTEAQLAAMAEEAAKTGGKDDKSHKKGIFEPDVIIDESVSPQGMYYDSVKKMIVFNTADIFKGEKEDVRQKEVTFKAKIVGKSAAGQSYYREVEEKFSVFKPVVEVQSNAVPRLLAECENSLRFNVPGIDPNTLVLTDKSTGMVIEGNSITWSPRGDTTTITVSRKVGDESQFIDTKGFKITPPPFPQVYMQQVDRSNSKTILNPSSKVSLRDDFVLVIKPDPQFLSDFPQDARYVPGGMKVSIARQGLAPQQGELSGNQLGSKQDKNAIANGEYAYRFNLADAMRSRPNGAAINLILTGLARVNYQNKRIELPDNTYPQQFSFQTN